jgi:ABC-2 type transport system permease protein
MAMMVTQRHGPRFWWASYRAMLRFDAIGLRAVIVSTLVVQLLIGAGMAYIYGFYLGRLSSPAATFMVTGIPALAMIPIGMVMVPNTVMMLKFSDTYDYIWSLPPPRAVAAASTVTVFTLLAVPATVASLWIAEIRYDVTLHVSLAVVPAMLLVSLMSTSVGYALGHGVPDPRTTNLITNLIVFVVLLFSPLVIPLDYFPGWAAAAHRVLPFFHMAAVMRASLTEGLVDNVTASYLVLTAWMVGSWGVAAAVIARRR